MNLFIFIFRDYKSCLSEIGAVIIEERALEERVLMQPTHMILQHSLQCRSICTQCSSHLCRKRVIHRHKHGKSIFCQAIQRGRACTGSESGLKGLGSVD